MKVLAGNIFNLRDTVEVDPETRQLVRVPGVLTRLKQYNERAEKNGWPLIPSKQGYWIAKFALKMNGEIALIEGQRDALINKYGAQQNGQFSVEQGGENWAEFIQEHNELMDIEIDLDVEPVKIPDNVNMPLGDLMLLDPFIEVITV